MALPIDLNVSKQVQVNKLDLRIPAYLTNRDFCIAREVNRVHSAIAPAPNEPRLYPSDHFGIAAELEIVKESS